MTPEQIEAAIERAFDTWERAAPALRFVYEGRTTVQAGAPDGVSVVGFNGGTIENVTPWLDNDGYVTEFDMLFGPTGWTWAPCSEADNSCTPLYKQDGAVTSTPRDLQSIGTHAAGHVLWLGDMTDNTLDRELTMYPDHTQHQPGSRFWSTLALGDVLGIRALYPCSCPLPEIHKP